MSGIDSISSYTNGLSGMNSISQSISNTSADKLEDKLNSEDLSKASSDELMSVCKDFEAYFVEQMVKSMVKMTNVTGEDNENDYSSIFGMSALNGDSDSGMSTLSGFFGDKMVTQISESICSDENGNGLGLAQTLYEQMKRNYGIEE